MTSKKINKKYIYVFIKLIVYVTIVYLVSSLLIYKFLYKVKIFQGEVYLLILTLLAVFYFGVRQISFLKTSLATIVALSLCLNSSPFFHWLNFVRINYDQEHIQSNLKSSSMDESVLVIDWGGGGLYSSAYYFYLAVNKREGESTSIEEIIEQVPQTHYRLKSQECRATGALLSNTYAILGSEC